MTKLLALDTETTGVDFRHGSAPFLVSYCDDSGVAGFWGENWTVDPVSRRVLVPSGEVGEIREVVESADRIVMHNPKFDVTALGVIGVTVPWGKVYDTLRGAHLLYSNRPKDLTSLAMQYLGLDLLPYEEALGVAVKKARLRCRKLFPDWRTAREDEPDMPSCKGEAWRSDYWLPRALWLSSGEIRQEFPAWGTVLFDYATADAEATYLIWQRMRPLIEGRRLWRIYEEAIKVLPIAHEMEELGVTTNRHRLKELRTRYSVEAVRHGRECEQIAKREFGHDLVLPAGGVNNNLRELCFEKMKLPPVRNPKAKTNAPTLNKEAITYYLASLPPGSQQLKFVEHLIEKRKRDTAIKFMDGYERFWLPLGITDENGCELWYNLHPNLNPTGSDTLRWSSSNPNEQNISKKGMYEGDTQTLRYVFGPPPGYEWWSLDAKNIELRIPFYESDQQDLIELFENPDAPPYYGSNHLANFHAVYPEIWEEAVREVGWEKAGPYCKKKYESTWYKWCKNGGFCKQYGGQKALTDATFRREGAFDLMEAKFDKLATLNQYQIRFAEKHGYVETIPDREVDPDRGYPIMCTRSEYGKVTPTLPLSYHVQGTAMWWTMKAMVRCQEQILEWRKAGFDCRIVMQVHDEIVFQLPKRAHPKSPRGNRLSNLPRVRALARLMGQGGDDIGIPTPVGIEYHEHHWSEGITF
jgi:DNA polymerase I-like protein with 3'-5' exonuclease and polymerase domains